MALKTDRKHINPIINYNFYDCDANIKLNIALVTKNIYTV